MQDPGNPVDLRPGDLLVVDDVAVCLEVEAVEDTFHQSDFTCSSRSGTGPSVRF